QHTGVVDQVARWKVVGAVDDDVVGLQNVEGVGRGQLRLVQVDLHLRVDRLEAVLRRSQLRPPHVGSAVQDLALQIAEVDDVEVDQAEAAHTGGGKIQAQRRAEAAGADQQYRRRLEALLPFDADLRHDEVPAVAFRFVGC